MIVDGVRELAYIVTIDEIRPIPGYDRVEHARTNGWWVIVKKDQFKVGDPAIYLEVDSKTPEEAPFDFLAAKHFKVKTLKMCKVYSQGLLLAAVDFGWEVQADGSIWNPRAGDHGRYDIGYPLTKELGITYATEEDNKRKANGGIDKYKAMAQRNPKIFKKTWVKWLMRRDWGKKLMFLLFGNKKKDKPLSFPTKFPFVHKTDEERVENIPYVLEDRTPWVATEKLDGTSSTYILERISHKGFKEDTYEFYVLSRNVRQMTPDQKCYHDDNIYWNNAFKYDIEKKLKHWLMSDECLSYVAIQGESVGNVQGNPLELKEDELYVFNLIDSINGRHDSIEGRAQVERWGMKWVPIISEECYLPEDMETMKQQATGYSLVNPKVLREGVVYRKKENNGKSFKNVSREFLLKHNG